MSDQVHPAMHYAGRKLVGSDGLADQTSRKYVRDQSCTPAASPTLRVTAIAKLRLCAITVTRRVEADYEIGRDIPMLGCCSQDS